MAKRKNIIFYFSDQQRWDTVNETVTPNLMQLAKEGTLFENNFTCQPVCGPARACLQTGVYATQCGCYWNGIPLPESITPLAHYFNEAGYDTAYVGKWHLASDRLPGIGTHCEATPVPKEKQGEYRYWRAADVLEFPATATTATSLTATATSWTLPATGLTVSMTLPWNTWRADGRQTNPSSYLSASWSLTTKTTTIITRAIKRPSINTRTILCPRTSPS